jgi:16S rRNA (uracil1498-N3)-methyltransferase
VDGVGGYYEGVIREPNHHRLEIRIYDRKTDFGKRSYHLHVAIAPTKNSDRYEWFLEKATEIGVDEVTPLICRHSERKKVNPERLNKILLSAMKQSLKAYLPKLNEAQHFNEGILRFAQNDSNSQSDSNTQKFICSGAATVSLKENYQRNQNVIILIGPEGDFSEEEIATAIKNNFVPVNLGSSRLRTETAALVAVTAINLINQ